MSEADPAAIKPFAARPSIRVPAARQSDPLYISRQILEVLLSAFPTEDQIDTHLKAWSNVAIPPLEDNPLLPPIFTEAWRDARQQWRRQIEAFPGYGLRSMVSREEMENRLSDNKPFMRWLSSPEAARMMWEMGDPKHRAMWNPLDRNTEPDEITQWNDRFYTHEEDGSLHEISADDIVKLFPAGREDLWPAQIILTSNHARTNSHTDVTELMQGIHAQVRHLLGKEKVALERHPDAVDYAPGKTIIVSALHAEDTALRNGADLMFRNIHLRQYQTLEKRMRPNTDPEERPTDLVAYDHRAASPAATMLGRLFMKSLAERPQDLDAHDQRTLRDITEDGEGPGHMVTLRRDAVAIADRFLFDGFSKAANTINDGIRLPLYDMQSCDSQGAALVGQRQEDGSCKPMDAHSIAAIMQKTGILGECGPGVRLTEEEKRLGVYRLRLRNSYDQVAGHFDRTDDTITTVDAHDVVVTVKGTPRHLGHAIEDALGKGDKEGYFIQPPEVRQMLQETLERKFDRTADDLPWLQPALEKARTPDSPVR